MSEGNFHVHNTLALEHYSCNKCETSDAFPHMPLDQIHDFRLDRPDAVKTFIKPLCLTAEEAIALEQDTRGQSMNDKWWVARQFRLPASRFGEITRRDLRKGCEKLVKNLTKRPKQSSNMPAPMKHGLQEESAAVRKYEQYMAHTGHKVHVFESGILVRPDLPFLGCTPDRKIIDPNFHPHYGLLEIKCPYTHKNITPMEAAKIDPTFCLGLNENRVLQLKKEHHY